MPSFGHAAWFGIGAYAAGLSVQWLGAPMPAALLLAPLAAGLAAALFGAFVDAAQRRRAGATQLRVA